MLNWIKGIFSSTYRKVRSMVKAVDAFMAEHWDTLEFALMVVKEIEKLHAEKPGMEKARLAFERIMGHVAANGWVVKTRWVNLAIEIAVFILKDREDED